MSLVAFCRYSKNKPKGVLYTDFSRIGMSSACFYPADTLDAVKQSIALGFENIEIFINTFSELEEPYLKLIKKECDEGGTKVVSLHPFMSGFEYMMFFSACKKRALDSADFYRRFFHAAAYLGASYTVFHGDATRSPFFGMDNYCEVFAHLMEVAKSEGVTLIHENVSTARAGEPEFMRELHERFGEGNIKFVFDLKQTARGGVDAHKMLDAMGSDIVHVHINDWKDGVCRLPYSGELDVNGIMSRLEREGYTGKYIIEVYRENFTHGEEIRAAADEILKREY